ncbi:hypothetical protein ANANG_G00306570 [Anguilla anguilla]|uniref:Uncharacterized protein n=1 Tax=Anguilla anguilla TaxID=7936 RepID=A0A9D3RIY3_ANGAN|nr:hypothetical protein ANANG_G00306570 [Anguilla anguilla]
MRQHLERRRNPLSQQCKHWGSWRRRSLGSLTRLNSFHRPTALSALRGYYCFTAAPRKHRVYRPSPPPKQQTQNRMKPRRLLLSVGLLPTISETHEEVSQAGPAAQAHQSLEDYVDSIKELAQPAAVPGCGPLRVQRTQRPRLFAKHAPPASASPPRRPGPPDPGRRLPGRRRAEMRRQDGPGGLAVCADADAAGRPDDQGEHPGCAVPPVTSQGGRRTAGHVPSAGRPTSARPKSNFHLLPAV